MHGFCPTFYLSENIIAELIRVSVSGPMARLKIGKDCAFDI